MHSKINLNDKVAVVTGAAKGIGRAIVETLTESGARVAGWDLEKTADEAGQFNLTVDVASRDSVSTATRQTVDYFGTIDILINNAGYGGPIAPLHEYPQSEWRKILAVNLDGVFNCCSEIVPLMRQQNWGRIVNIASLAGKEGTPGAGPYSISKAGVIALTKAMGKENADKDVLINCIAPAAIDTAMLDQFTDKHVQIMIDKSPMGRLGKVDEVATLTAWLSSADLSFSTGAVFDLSGGRATY